MTEDRRLEIKVGILIAAALLGIAGLLLLMDSFAPRGELISVDLTHSGGIPVGAPIRMAGIKIGRVTDLKLLPDRMDERGLPLPVHMELEIDSEVFSRLHEGTKVEFATQGPLGETYLALSQGNVASPLLKPGAQLVAHPPRLELLIPRLMDLLDSLQALSGSAEEGGEVRTLVSELLAVASGARKFLEEQGPTLGEAVSRLSRSAASLEKMAAQGESMMGEGGELSKTLRDLAAVSSLLKKELPAIAAKAQKTLDNAAALSSAVTPEDLAALKASLQEAEAASKRLADLVEHADNLLSDADKIVGSAGRVMTVLEEGHGTLGAVLQDDEIYLDLRDLISDLKAHPWKVLWKN